MRMKMVCDDRTLAEVANEFLALKKAQKVRERTLNDYKKYIDKFLEQSQNSLDVDVLKIEILEYFADIPKTSPARFNHTFLSEIWMRHLPHRYSGPGASCGRSSSQKSEKQKIAQSSFSMTWTIEMIRKIF